MRRNEWIGLLVVLILATAIRLYRVDAVEFYHDEAMLGMLAQEMADGQTFPLQGIVSSVGIPNPPQTVYTILPPFWFSNDPVFITSWVILLNIIGVALLYIITLRQFGFAPALLAATFYAVNPWAVMYSRKLWAQDYVNPFLLLALFFAQLGFRDGKRWAQILTVPVMLWGMQIHFAAWALVPLFGWIILAGRKNWHIRSLIFSAILSLLVLTPFILGIIQTLSQDPTRIGDSLSASAGRDLDGGLSPWVHWVSLLTGEGIETWLLPPNEGMLITLPLLTVIFLIPLFLTAVWSLFRRYGWGMWGAFALWLILPTVAFDIMLSDVWPHYFIPLLPGFAMLLSLTLTHWDIKGQANSPSTPTQGCLFDVLVILGGINALIVTLSIFSLVVSVLQYDPNKLSPFMGTYEFVAIELLTGAILGYVFLKPLWQEFFSWRNEHLVRFILVSSAFIAFSNLNLNWVGRMYQVAEYGSFRGSGTSGYTTPSYVLTDVASGLPREISDIVVLTRDMDVWFDSEAARWPVILRDEATCIRALPRNKYAVLPNHPFFVINTPDAEFDSAINDIYSGGLQPRKIYDRSETYGSYNTSIFEVAPTWTRAPMTDLAMPVQFDNDVLLTGYGFVEGELYLRWSLPDAPDRRFYESRAHNVQFFAHILDADGNRVGQLDKQFWHARHWCAGDTLYTWGNIEGTDSAALLRVGFYRLGLGKDKGQTFPLDVLDVMGNPAGNWVDILMP